MSEVQLKVTGVGSPIMDLLAHVSDDFVSTYAGEKGGMELVDAEVMSKMVENLPDTPKLAAGGSAANTVFAMARLGMPCGFVGKVGRDSHAEQYLGLFQKYGGEISRFKYNDQVPTALCLSLVTPDYERTMRTFLGAAATLAPDEIVSEDFAGYAHVHVEGYLLFNQELLLAVLDRATKAGCTISLDLGSFEIVNAFKDLINDILEKYIDIVFANEDESKAFCGSEDPEVGLAALSEKCSVAVVKLGAEGSLIQDELGVSKVSANMVENAVDTTGAGDYWAAGFLHGYLNGYTMGACGQMGSILGAEVVQQLGAELPEERWEAILEQFENIPEDEEEN